MTTYTVWIGADDSYSSTYCGETGAVRLTKEQIEKYITIDEDGELEFDEEQLSDIVNENVEEDTEFPVWSTITDGCFGWGPYIDQKLGVCVEGKEDEEPLFLEEIEDLEFDDNIKFECNHELKYDDEDFYVVYHSAEKGGYGGTLEIDGEFDPSKLTINTLNVADEFTIVSGVCYDGEDIDLSGDTTGKSLDFFIFHNGSLYNL